MPVSLRPAALRMAASAALAVACGPALAHGPIPVTPDTLGAFWTFDPLVLVPLVAAQLLYGRGLGSGRLRLRPGPAGQPPTLRWTQAAAFIAAQAVIVLALVSPLAEAGGTLFTAHMLQHALLAGIAPPLYVLARADLVMLAGLPRSARRWVGRSAVTRGAMAAVDAASRPAPAAILHGLALWVWHLPGPFDLATGDALIHALEHASLFGTALLFWRGALKAATPAAGAAASFFTLAHGGLLGGLITLAPAPLYGWYEGRSALWGLSTLEDQQLAGLVMWVPLGFVYFAACMLAVSRLARAGSTFREPEMRHA